PGDWPSGQEDSRGESATWPGRADPRGWVDHPVIPGGRRGIEKIEGVVFSVLPPLTASPIESALSRAGSHTGGGAGGRAELPSRGRTRPGRARGALGASWVVRRRVGRGIGAARAVSRAPREPGGR